ncbi:hypothetical protein DL96DRAFT_1703287 [Flagelloscypha sp. PMI_526]|nr:hypothetical protein DL96DRAFT_1703287 [Flagelloscypha sp. PMI_526]
MPHDKYGFDTSDDSDSLAGYWSWSTAILLVGFSSILLFFPRLLVFLAELGRSKGDTALTPLESFLSVQFGLFMIAVAIAIVLNIPGASAPVPTEPRGANHALILPISSAAVLSSLLAYNAGQTRQIGPLSDVVFFISGTIGVFGLWTASVHIIFCLLRLTRF